MPIPEALLKEADEIGVRLEVVNGLGVWEAHPLYRHQDAALRIVNSIHPLEGAEQRCGCFRALDVVVRFPDGSQKRPDISIFCEEPPADTEIEMLPAAVVEIISRGYEKKDLEIGVPFYLSQGVRDVVVLDPYSGEVLHHRRGDVQKLQSPADLVFECSCACTV